MRRRIAMVAAPIAAAAAGLLWANRPSEPLRDCAQVDRIVVDKSHHTLTLFCGGAARKTYAVAVGPGRGNKQREGDRRTPEGRYVIAARKPASCCHRAFLISYPNAADRARGATGGDIEIHGVSNALGWIGSFAVARDWTSGCIAMRNSDIDELWRAVPAGTPIEINP